MSTHGITTSMRRSETSPRIRRVLILGGGFGGAYAARRLAHTLGKRQDVEVVLISRENYLLFTPMLHEVAAGDLYPPDIVVPLRPRLRGIRFMEGEVMDIDLSARVVRYSVGLSRRSQQMDYDYLLLALGSETNYFDMPGVAAHAANRLVVGSSPTWRNKGAADAEIAGVEIDGVTRRGSADGGIDGSRIISAAAADVPRRRRVGISRRNFADS